MKDAVRALALLLLVAGIPAYSQGQEPAQEAAADGEKSAVTQEAFTLYGYIKSYNRVDLLESADFGSREKLRLKGDWRPEERLSFHLELSWIASLGTLNDIYLQSALGLSSSGILPLSNGLEVDHAWGLANLGMLDLQVGKVPIAWGTGYVFNPSDRVNVARALQTDSDAETPGTLGILASIYFPRNLTLMGYLAFQDRSHKEWVGLSDSRWENLPFGAKIKGVAGPVDFSMGFLREVLYDPFALAYVRACYATTDAVANLLGMNLYVEAALRLSDETGKIGFTGWKLDDNLDGVVGLLYSFADPLAVDIRVEYFYQGQGAKDKNEYDIRTVLSGELAVQGRHYLFLYLERTFFNFHRLSLGSLVNLSDGSFALVPEYQWQALNNLTLTFGSLLFMGAAASEFSGEVDLGALGGTGTADILRPAVYAGIKLAY